MIRHNGNGPLTVPVDASQTGSTTPLNPNEGKGSPMGDPCWLYYPYQAWTDAGATGGVASKTGAAAALPKVPPWPPMIICQHLNNLPAELAKLIILAVTDYHRPPKPASATGLSTQSNPTTCHSNDATQDSLKARQG